MVLIFILFNLIIAIEQKHVSVLGQERIKGGRLITRDNFIY